jgi:hypothetical protein
LAEPLRRSGPGVKLLRETCNFELSDGNMNKCHSILEVDCWGVLDRPQHALSSSQPLMPNTPPPFDKHMFWRRMTIHTRPTLTPLGQVYPVVFQKRTKAITISRHSDRLPRFKPGLCEKWESGVQKHKPICRNDRSPPTPHPQYLLDNIGLKFSYTSVTNTCRDFLPSHSL